MDLSAAYDTVNHRLLIQKLYNTTQDSKLCRVIQNLLPNRRFYVELKNECSRWRTQNNGLPQSSVLAPTLLNMYINDRSIHNGTGASYTQTIYVSRPSTNHSSNLKKELKRNWTYGRSLLDGGSCYDLIDLGLVLYEFLPPIPPSGTPIIGSNTLGSCP